LVDTLILTKRGLNYIAIRLGLSILKLHSVQLKLFSLSRSRFFLKVPLRFHLNFLSRNAALLAEAKVSLFVVHGC
jgi:hypothetical protein